MLNAVLAIGVSLMGATGPRNDWYWDSVVNLHVDNHSHLVGKGYTVDQLVEMVKDIDVSMIQVSAMGANGTTTYQTRIMRNPQLDDWDTLTAWRQVARRLGRKFGVYINTRGLQLHKRHSEWAQLDAQGKGKGRGRGLDICMRPSADGGGALEQVFLPMLAEFGTRDEPDALWVDGDHARTAVCYCPNCRAAWAKLTGLAEPPRSPDEPRWADWLRLEQDRFDAYREQMARAIHEAAPGCMYTSNHSWRFRTKDVRCAPGYVDTLSGDLSHGMALRLTRLSAMQISPEGHVPCDIMHNVMRISRKPVSFRRVAQQGAVTMAAGGAWFLWSPGGAIVQKPVQQRLKQCADFAQARRVALGRSTSANPVAVLLSETSWRRMRIGGEADAYDPDTPSSFALGLQDAAYGVDMPNEAILRERIGGYQVVVAANQRRLAPETVRTLDTFVRGGGVLLVTGAGLQRASDLLGVRRARGADGPDYARLGDEVLGCIDPWRLEPAGARVAARFKSGRPLLTVHSVGKGRVACLAVSHVAYPDQHQLAGWVMRRLGFGPGVHVEGPGRESHLVFSLRRKPGQLILHVADLTSRVKGRPVSPSQYNDIDDEPPLAEVKLSLAMTARPTRVTVTPATTRVQSDWADGVLRLTLRHVTVHAAVTMAVDADTRATFMPDSTPMAAPRRLTQVIQEDFEGVDEGGRPLVMLGQRRVKGATRIRVTDTTAASGKRSLEFVDHPNAPQPFFPYLVLHPSGLNQGTGRLSFDLRLDKAARVQVELREVENAKRFPVGPSLTFTASDGLQRFGGKKPLCKLPDGQWFHVDLAFALDGRATYDVTVRAPGQRERTFRRLPCRSPKFWRCAWIGFIGMGKDEAAFHLDNVRVERQR